ncbi:MAG: hypothetical protein FJY42_01945 [Betaproteobacteria bacterium]|nr:hypothetical protein [Betaproteobacteria bacterium]
MPFLPVFAPGGADEARLFAQPIRARGRGYSLQSQQQRRRWRARAAGLVLLHRLQARVSQAAPQAGMRERAAQMIALTARLWLA